MAGSWEEDERGVGAGRGAASAGQGAPEKGDLYSEEVKALFTWLQSRFFVFVFVLNTFLY